MPTGYLNVTLARELRPVGGVSPFADDEGLGTAQP
jgi:hypothetical protein